MEQPRETFDEAPALRLVDIRKSFGRVEVLRSVCLDVRCGERHALIGPNGAGKTTLFNVACGQTRPGAGRVDLFGRDVTFLPLFRRARLGLGRTFQVASLFRNLTVRENLLLAAMAPGRRPTGRPGNDPLVDSPEECARGLMEWAGLAHKSAWPVGSLSYGEQRRLEVALAMAARPRVLLMDEPMAGLGQEERFAVAESIRRLPPQTAVLLIEHDLDMALSLAHRVTVLHLGEIFFQGSPDEVRSSDAVRRIYTG